MNWLTKLATLADYRSPPYERVRNRVPVHMHAALKELRQRVEDYEEWNDRVLPDAIGYVCAVWAVRLAYAGSIHMPQHEVHILSGIVGNCINKHQYTSYPKKIRSGARVLYGERFNSGTARDLRQPIWTVPLHADSLHQRKTLLMALLANSMSTTNATTTMVSVATFSYWKERT